MKSINYSSKALILAGFLAGAGSLESKADEPFGIERVTRDSINGNYSMNVTNVVPGNRYSIQIASRLFNGGKGNQLHYNPVVNSVLEGVYGSSNKTTTAWHDLAHVTPIGNSFSYEITPDRLREVLPSANGTFYSRVIKE